MRRRLVLAMVAVAAVATVALGVPLGVLGQRDVREAAEVRLERSADRLAARLQTAVARGEPVDAARVAALLGDRQRARVRLPDGRVLVAGPAPGHEPVRATAGTGGALTVALAAPEGSLDRRIGGVWLAVIGLAIPALLVAVGIAVLQGRRLARPLEDLATDAITPATGAAPRSGIAEIDAVASALEAGRADLHQVLARERAFSADVAHQLRSPLTGLRMRLEELEQLSAPGAAREEAGAAIAVADRLERVIAELEHYAKEGDAGPVATVDVAAAARESAGAWRRRLERERRAIVVEASDQVLARTAEGALRQALDVLLDNAARHGAGQVTVTVAAELDAVVVTVADAGRGVPADRAEAIFARRVSDAGGSGLGLAVARGLLRAGGGDLRLAAPAAFAIVLPAAPAPR